MASLLRCSLARATPEVVVRIRIIGRNRGQFGQHLNGAARAVLLQVEPSQGQQHLWV